MDEHRRAAASAVRRLLCAGPCQSYEIQRRNQRQAIRRALGRLQKLDIVCALALGWCEVGSGEMLRWQGGGKRTGAYADPTPNWRTVSLTDLGVKAATALERDAAASQ